MCYPRLRRDVYFQVTEALILEGKCFPKGSLKHFVRWLFKEFSDISVYSVCQLGFWDSAGERLFFANPGGVEGCKVLSCFSFDLF